MLKFFKKKYQDTIHMTQYMVLCCCTRCGTVVDRLPDFMPEMMGTPMSWGCCPTCGGREYKEVIGKIRYMHHAGVAITMPSRYRYTFLGFVPKGESDEDSE